ncbi:DNA polymerase Y family protein [Actinoplanes bogorensis]|uniref:DNA polymerase Y family protein n=1 Tax=Paractinoplanes bogorensis TaxID=1610840 RepID=A0ABS5YSF4_9ACTN|nr:DNA polymerase Y family protein [Actinoplanes bogorensis]MBU2665658.1 DNA polymerase Y family protein [Actinoplanes bogorensis]
MLLWCPDWPVIAAEIVLGVAAAQPVIVLHGNRVVACSEAARREGVRRGLRRREAQSRCPQVEAVEHDPGRDARAFEPVVAAVEEVAPGVEVIRPGACALAARGPSRYFGGEEAAAERIVEQVAESCEVESQVGIAEGVFAAGLAARAGRVIPVGETSEFLRGQPIEAIERPGLTDLLKRLGLKTLGEFAALPAGDVLTRFGFDGALAHRLAAGFDHRPLAVRRPPPDLEVSETYDEPLDRVDMAAFAGRALAEKLHDKLAAHGLACTRLGIEAVTANGQELHRVWRHDGTLTSAAIAERVRWQLDGWLTGARRGAPARPTAGLVRLRLVPDGVLVHLGLQPGLWGDAGADRERAHRAFSRVQGLLGPDAVVTPVLTGGRNADDQIRLVPWGDERDPHRPAGPHPDPVPGITTVPVLSHQVQPELALDLPNPDFPVRDEPAPAVDMLPANVHPIRRRTDISELSAVEDGARRRATEGGTQPEVDAAAALGGARRQEVDAAVASGEAQRREVVAGGAAAPEGRRGKRALAKPPWPGRLPKPAPALVLTRPLPAVVLDQDGNAVGVSARLDLTGSPAALIIERAHPLRITGWAGPWPVDERWWDGADSRRRARFQIVLEDGRAYLLSLSGGHWAVEAFYD